MLKISVFLNLIIFYLKHQVAESIFCYECDAKWQPCADPPDLNIIQHNTVPCLGSCVTSYNPYDGNILYRTCSDALDPVVHLGGQFGTFNGNDGNLYYLCNTEKCNAGGGPKPTIKPSSFSVITKSTYPVVIDCGLVPCKLNQGYVNLKNCECQCYTNYEGPECESIKGCYDNPKCSSYKLTSADCASPFTKSQCPNSCSEKCFKTTTLSPPTKTNTICYDNPTCASYSLKLSDCSSAFTVSQCPKTCACIQNTSPSTTPVTTTTTTTTRVPTTTTTTTRVPTTTTTTTPGSTTTADACFDNPTCSSFKLTASECVSVFTKTQCPKTCECIRQSTPKPTTTPVPTTTADACFDNPTCSQFSLTLSDCSFDFTRSQCPKTCECVRQSTPKPTTTPVPTTTADACFDNPTCSQFSLTLSDCSFDFTRSQCPKTCACIVTTTASKTLKTCDQLKCVYGTSQINSDGNCICVCNDKYYGPECDKLNITNITTTPDPTECNYLGCSDEDVIALCPITCKVCGGTTFCQSGGYVNADNCQCNCPNGFTGNNCETMLFF